jgi:cold shock CspA family protein
MRDQILDSYLNSFVTNRKMEALDESKSFEHFANFCVISKHYTEDFDPESVAVGGPDDLGIDGLAIILNDKLVSSIEEIDFFRNTFHRLDVQFIFIQSKRSPHFDSSEIGNFAAGVRHFFDRTKPEKMNRKIHQNRLLMEHIYKFSIDMDKPPVCLMYYATTGKWTEDTSICSRIDQCVSDINQTGLFSSTQIIPLDCENLKQLYKELNLKITREFVFEKHTILPQIVGVDEAYLGIVPCSEYLKLICDDSGNLNRRLFYNNVRDFQGRNSVNVEIESTIRNKSHSDQFSIINNGVTIVARDVNKVGATFRLKDYQIVNGCQTSYILYFNRSELTDTVYLPIRLIVTSDPDVENKIIKGTNRQSEVKIEAFESLQPFQKKLEEFYLAMQSKVNFKLLYERRSKQYDSQGLQHDHIIKLGTQINSFIAMFLNEPHSTHRYYGELLSSYRSRMFSDSHSAFPYFLSGSALMKVERMFFENMLDRKLKQYKYQILMVFRLLNQEKALPYLNSKKIDGYCHKILDILNDEAQCQSALVQAGKIILDTQKMFQERSNLPERTKALTDALINKTNTNYSQAASTSLLEGTVKIFKEGWGFIQGNDSCDYFVHYNNIQGKGYRWLELGQRVQFIRKETDRGPQAVEVKVISNYPR